MKKVTELTQDQKRRADEFGKMIGLIIARRRNEKGWSQNHLADIAGLNPKTVNNIENGKIYPSKGCIIKLSDAFGCTPSELFQYEKSAIDVPQNLNPDFWDEQISSLIVSKPMKSDTVLKLIGRVISAYFDKNKRNKAT